MPCPADIAARDAVSDATLKLIPSGATTAEIRFDSILTTEECLLLFGKMIKTFESDIEDLDTIEAKVKCRPKTEIFMQSRQIVHFFNIQFRHAQ